MKIGVIADDLTGGGDVGIQFADRGLKVVLSTSTEDIESIPVDVDVWIINTHSRSASEKKAEEGVVKAVEFLKSWNADFYYKKIDSTLRGNIGVELEALLESLKVKRIPLCAAFPDMGRVTVNSTHYVDGVEISKSSYGRDIKSPVNESNIKILLSNQMNNPEKIDVKDASTNEDLKNLSRGTPGNVFAGASAWAGELTDCWLSGKNGDGSDTSKKGNIRTVPILPIPQGPVLIVSGSLNPLSLKQIDYWEKSRRRSIGINEPIACVQGWGDENLLVKTPTKKITGSLRKLNDAVSPLESSKVILNGGDTAYGFMRSTGIRQVNVIKSIITGIALTEYKNRYIVLKPGGYGEADTLVKLAELLSGAKT